MGTNAFDSGQSPLPAGKHTGCISPQTTLRGDELETD
jgi:hypothetical protein